MLEYSYPSTQSTIRAIIQPPAIQDDSVLSRLVDRIHFFSGDRSPFDLLYADIKIYILLFEWDTISPGMQRLAGQNLMKFGSIKILDPANRAYVNTRDGI